MKLNVRRIVLLLIFGLSSLLYDFCLWFLKKAKKIVIFPGG